MRLRKIHTVVAVSVALVLVARTIEARRRSEAWAPAEPVQPPAEAEAIESGPVEAEPLVNVTGTEAGQAEAVQAEAVQAEAVQAEAVQAEAEATEADTTEADATETEPLPVASTGRAIRRPLALLSLAIVLAGALAGTLLVVTAGASPSLHP